VKVAAHYQHLTLIAARRAAAKARGKRNKKDGKEGKDGQVRDQCDVIALEECACACAPPRVIFIWHCV